MIAPFYINAFPSCLPVSRSPAAMVAMPGSSARSVAFSYSSWTTVGVDGSQRHRDVPEWCRCKTHTKEPPVTDIIRIGLDTSKSVFQLHGVDRSERPVLRKQMARREMIRFFEKLPPTIVALEGTVRNSVREAVTVIR